MKVDNKPLFSITTPCLNSVLTIEKTIISILSQSFKDYEYIIVDGGSTDGTLDIIKKYEPYFEGRMSWTSGHDKGIYDAFNKCIKRSKGVFCWNVNADDYIVDDALEQLSMIASSHKDKMCIIYGMMVFCKNDNSRIVNKLLDYDGLKKSAHNYSMGIPHPASIFSKSVYDEIGLYDDRYYISGDIDMFIRCFRSNKVLFVSINKLLIYMKDGGVSNLFNFKKRNHDYKLRYKKFASNRLEYLWLLFLADCKLLKWQILRLFEVN